MKPTISLGYWKAYQMFLRGVEGVLHRKEAPIVAIETERNYGGMKEQVRLRNRQQVESHRGVVLVIMDRAAVGTSHGVSLVPFSCPR